MNHIQQVRKLPCCNCYAPPDSEAAHIRLGSQAGKGRKPKDDRVVPLCSSCHRTGPRAQHIIGEIRFWGRRLPLAIDLAAKLFRADFEGKQKLIYEFWKENHGMHN